MIAPTTQLPATPSLKLPAPLGQLIDPITAKEQNVHHVPTDTLLELTPWEAAKLNVKTATQTLPKAVARGLSGDKNFTFSDFMLSTKIPYYLGGLVLTGVFAAADPKGLRGLNPTKIAIGSVLYYTGVTLANKFVDALYKARYGLDLNLKYVRSDGRVDRAFGSADFAYTNIMSDKQYEEIRDKMGIPADIADYKRAVRENIPELISSSRATKLVLGNVLAAVGAGYLARSDGWARLLGHNGTVWAALADRQGGNIINRVMNAASAVGGIIAPPLREKIAGLPGEPNQLLRIGVLTAMGGAVAATVLRTLILVKPKAYESTDTQLKPSEATDSVTYTNINRPVESAASSVQTPPAPVADAVVTGSVVPPTLPNPPLSAPMDNGFAALQPPAAPFIVPQPLPNLSPEMLMPALAMPGAPPAAMPFVPNAYLVPPMMNPQWQIMPPVVVEGGAQ